MILRLTTANENGRGGAQL